MDPIKDLDNLLNVTLETANSLKLVKPETNPKDFSVLSVKSKSLANYQINLLKIKLFQIDSPGESLQNDPDISETVFATTRDRTKLERIRNLELKIQPKIDNYMKILKEGGIDRNDPNYTRSGLMEGSDSDDDTTDSDEHDGRNSDKNSNSINGQFKGFDGSDEDRSDQGSGSEIETEKFKSASATASSEKYVPPKLKPTPYPFDKPTKLNPNSQKSTATSKINQDHIADLEGPGATGKIEKSRQKALKSRSALGELIETIGDAPIESIEVPIQPVN